MIEVSTSEQYEKEVMESSVPVVIDFWAAWCGPCRAMAPTFELVADLYEGKAKFVKIDIEGNPKFTQALAGEFEIRGIPAFVIVTSGMLTDKLVGAVSQGRFMDWLKANLPQ